MANKKRQMIRETENGREKWCSGCKDYHPATDEYFYNDNGSKYKLTSSCKAHQKKEKQKNKSKSAGKRAVNLKLVLDFSEYKILYEDLVAEAPEEFRTPEQHAMYLIAKSLNNTTEKGDENA